MPQLNIRLRITDEQMAREEKQINETLLMFHQRVQDIQESVEQQMEKKNDLMKRAIKEGKVEAYIEEPSQIVTPDGRPAGNSPLIAHA